MADDREYQRMLASANEQFKDESGSWFWASLIAATLVHFVVFAAWPTLRAEGTDLSVDPLTTLVIPPEIVIPPPPEQIARPAMPVVSDVDISDEITIPETTLPDDPATRMDKPPTRSTSENRPDAMPFTPFTVAPRLLNSPEIERALQRNYPALLRNAGIGGRIVVQLHISEAGEVLQSRVAASSGYETMDQAALNVVSVMRFAAAINRDMKVAVWVEIPITFEAKDGA
jgi:TonB family protein